MTTTETKRFRLRERLHDLMEEEHVTTLMDSLPPIGWDKLATKEDLEAVEERLSAKFDAKIEKGLARTTYVILAGVAAALAAAMIPIYVALFTG